MCKNPKTFHKKGKQSAKTENVDRGTVFLPVLELKKQKIVGGKQN